MRNYYPKKAGQPPSGRKILQNQSVEYLFNIILSPHGFPWKKSNIALKDGDQHLLTGTLTCCQVPSQTQHRTWIVAEVLQFFWTGRFCQLERRAAPPVLPITMGYTVVPLGTLSCQCKRESDPNPNRKLLLIITPFPVGILLMHTTLPFTTWSSKKVVLLIFFYISPLSLKQFLLAHLAWQILCPLSPERSDLTLGSHIVWKSYLNVIFSYPSHTLLHQDRTSGSEDIHYLHPFWIICKNRHQMKRTSIEELYIYWEDVYH